MNGNVLNYQLLTKCTCYQKLVIIYVLEFSVLQSIAASSFSPLFSGNESSCSDMASQKDGPNKGSCPSTASLQFQTAQQSPQRFKAQSVGPSWL